MMNRTARLSSIVLIAGQAWIASAQSPSGWVQISKVSFDHNSVAVSGGERCATATVQAAIVGLGRTSSPGPTVSVNLVQTRAIPPDLAVEIESLDSNNGLPLTSSPGVFRFRVCTTGIPKGFVNGVVNLQGAVLLVSPESEWTSHRSDRGADTATLNVTALTDTDAKPELRLVVTPLTLEEAAQNGEAAFHFDVVAGQDFTGTVIGLLRIAAKNPDQIELLEGFNSGSFFFSLGPGQKLSDNRPVGYRIRTKAQNSHAGVLTYQLQLEAPGNAFRARDAAQEVTVKVGGAQAK